jgi:hypothetical protein
MAHRHQTPEPGCFGCKVAGVGFQGLKSRQGPDPVHKVQVVADEGVRAGRTVGQKAEHWDGRTDATVFAPQVTVKATTRET